jgi:PAS domain S-box-containing protein
MKFQWRIPWSEQFLQATLNALSAHIAVLDSSGQIVAVNNAWRRFAQANGLNLPDVGLGANYLDICISAANCGIQEADLAGQGIRSILDRTQTLFHLEYPCHSPTEQRWFALRITGFEYQAQSWAVVAHENITERIQAEAALRHSEARYRAIVESQTELICRAAPDGTFNFVNEAYCHYYGKRSEELIGGNLNPPPILAEDRQMLAAYYASLTSENPIGQIEHRVVLPNKDIRWQQWTDRALFDEQGHLVEYQSVGRDITEQQRAREALQESEQRFRNLVEGSIQGILVHRDTKPLFVNRAYAHILGYDSPDEILGLDTVLPLVAPYEQERLLGYHAARVKGESAPSQYEYDALRKDGSIVALQHLVTTINWDGEPAVMTAIVDITWRKQAEQELRKSEERYRGVVEDTPGLICCFLPGGEITFVNKTYCDYFARTPEELVGSNFLSLIPAADRETVMANISALTVEAPTQSHEHQVVAPGEAIRWQHWTNRALFDAEGKVIAYQSIGEDITERKRVEEALHYSEKRFRALVENIPDALTLNSADGTVLYQSPAASRILGYALDELVNINPFEFIHPDDVEAARKVLAQLLQEPQKIIKAQYRVRRKDGLWRWVEVITHNLLDEPGVQAIVGNYRDITERKQAELALQESEARLRSVVNNVVDGVITIDERGIIETFNPAAEKIFGYAAAEVQGQDIGLLMAEPYRSQHDDYLANYLRTGQARVIGIGREVEGRGKDGSTFPLDLAVGEFYQGEHRMFIGVVRDITERKRVEEALRESEQKYRTLFELAGDAILTVRPPDGKILDANMATVKMLGYSKEELQALGGGKDIVAPEVFEETEYEWATQLANQGDFLVETLWVRKDGSRCPVAVSGKPVEIKDEVLLQLIGRDITERVQAEKALRESELKYRTLVERIPAITYIAALDETSTTLYISPRQVEEILGFAAEEWQAKGHDIWFQQLHPADRERVLAEAAAGYASPAPFVREYRMLSRDERLVWIRDEAVVVRDEAGQPLFRQGVMSDITALKQAEAELCRRNRELSLLNKIIAASAAGLEPETLLETACRELALTFNLPEVTAALFNESKTMAEVVAEYKTEERSSALNLVVPVERNPATQYLFSHKTPLVVDNTQHDPYLAPLHDLMRQRGVVSLLMLPLLINEEVIGSLNLIATELRPFSTEEINLAWSVADQVAGALARARLGQSRRLLSAAVEQSAESVIITDTEGIILYVNPTFEQISGYSRSEALGQTPRLLKSGRQESAFYRELWTAISAGRVWHGRLINKKKDGALYTIDTIITPVRDEHSQIVNYVALQRDITHELRLEEQLRQSQKMEAIGRLAGGVAHDFNNLLTVIIGHTEFLSSSYLNSDDPRLKEVEQIRKAGERAALLTRQLLAFSRQQPTWLQILNLNQVVTGIKDMLSRLIGEHITLLTDLAPDLGRTRADPAQIEQVLMNLVVNARDAMPGGGKLTIKTANVELDELYAARHLNVSPGPYVMLVVADTGLGMDAETMSRIFEPFFTTKEVGKGTGLGLSTVYGIVQQNDGHIRVDSTPGQGSAFSVYLPLIKETAPIAASRPVTATSPEGKETILLVEDETNVRLITRKFLEKRGYRVLEAGHARQALHLCWQHAGRIDLLITDVVMPDLSGPELAEQLAQIQPRLKIIFISGYADDVLKQHGIPEPHCIFLEKPFSSEALAQKVREALDDK